MCIRDRGREVIFTNTIIIATSNIASKEIADLISQGRRYSEVIEAIMPTLRNYLRIEFLNRFDKLIMFKPLLRMEVEEIANLMLRSIVDRLKDKGINMSYSRESVSYTHLDVYKRQDPSPFHFRL